MDKPTWSCDPINRSNLVTLLCLSFISLSFSLLCCNVLLPTEGIDVVVVNHNATVRNGIVVCEYMTQGQISRVEQKLFTLPLHTSSLSIFCGVGVVGFCIVFCISLFVTFSFLFWSLHCLILRYTASPYPFWYIQTFLVYYCSYIYDKDHPGKNANLIQML